MRSLRVAFALVGAIAVALAFASPVSAATEYISGGTSFDLVVGEFGFPGSLIQGSELSFSWTSDMPLTLTIDGPSGLVKSYTASHEGDDTIDIDETGVYTMTWTNSGASTATLVYDYDVNLFAPAEDVLDAIVVGLIVVAIIVVVVIVLVVVLVMRGGQKKEQAARVQQPYQQFQPLSPSVTTCPNCGASIDGTTIWCARCGTKLR